MTKQIARGSIALAITILLAGCATVPTRSYAPRPFTEGNMSQVKVGVGPDVIERLFGPPDTTYTMTFGKDVGEEWQGVAWRYYAVRDQKYVHSDEWKKNIFYFYRAPTGALTLNHWTFEHPDLADPSR